MNTDLNGGSLGKEKRKILYTNEGIYSETGDGIFRKIHVARTNAGHIWAEYLAERSDYEKLVSMLMKEQGKTDTSDDEIGKYYSYSNCGYLFSIAFEEFVDPWLYPYYEDLSFITLEFPNDGTPGFERYIYEAVRLDNILENILWHYHSSIMDAKKLSEIQEVKICIEYYL